MEILGKLTKPFALAIRLFANMTAGHIVILSLIGLIFVFAPDPGLRCSPWRRRSSWRSAIMLLELFVAFLQAYIFAMLTAVFIGLIRARALSGRGASAPSRVASHFGRPAPPPPS